MTKYHHVVASLDMEIVELLSDFVGKPPSTTPYNDLKAHLIMELQDSSAVRTRTLFKNLELGNRKPSSFPPAVMATQGEGEC